MMITIERWLRLDRYQNPREQALARSLYIAGFLACGASGLMLLNNLAAGTFDQVCAELGGLVVSLVMLALTWAGHFRLAGWIFPSALFMITTYQVYTKNGIYNQTVFIFPLLIILAGLFAGIRGILIFTVLSLAVIGWIGSYQVFAPTPFVFQDTASSERLTFTLLIIAGAGVLVWVLVNNFLSSLRRLGASERDMAAANRELQAIRSSLEEKIIERTRSAEAARREAETARDALQVRAWLANGQVLLSAEMRGDLDIHTLARRVIAQVCQYLGAQVGALYVSDGQVLELAGGYALSSVGGASVHVSDSSTETAAQHFKFGEGLVGQVARNGQIMHFQDMPPDYLPIASGLGWAAPCQLLLAPFSYGDRVIGVLELGAFQPFTAAHINYLEQVGEGIAIAFYTAQARERMDALLDETQRQTADLMVREEELRAANEELQAQTDHIRSQADKT